MLMRIFPPTDRSAKLHPVVWYILLGLRNENEGTAIVTEGEKGTALDTVRLVFRGVNRACHTKSL